MKLRTQIAAALHARLVDLTPEAVQSAWGIVDTTVALEELTFVSDGGDAKGWLSGASFTGVVRSELKSDQIDDLDLSPLIVSLAQAPLMILRDEQVPVGDIGIACRATLHQSRDVLRATHVVTALRFKVQGTIWTRGPDVERPEALISSGATTGSDAARVAVTSLGIGGAT